MLRNSMLVLRVTAPAVAVGLVLLIACLAGVSYISRIQRNLAEILADNVNSLQAAQKLELAVRQLRFHSLLYLMDPSPLRLDKIENDQAEFESSLDMARQSSSLPEELELVTAIASGYEQFRAEQSRLRADVTPGKPAAALTTLVDSHPVQSIVIPCKDLLRINRERMDKTAEDAAHAARQGSLAMILLGIAGPVGGLVIGYGVARGLRRSIYRLSVRVQDMAQHLDHDIASVSVVANGDFQTLDSQMQQIVGKVEEVTGRLQRQQRKLLRAEQLAVVGQLAAGVAHEVRNPLTGIKMLVEAARRPQNPRPLDSEDLRVINRELGRVEQTVQGLLDYARSPTLNLAPRALPEIVEHAVEVVRARVDQQHVVLRVEGPDQPARAHVDVDQMHTVVVNLLQNALDAMPEGGQLEVTLKTVEGDVCLSVADSGPGIPDEIADKLFTPFATTKSSGTGLGLSLSARIVEEHGGTLTATNRPHGGALFTIRLPRLTAENAT